MSRLLSSRVLAAVVSAGLGLAVSAHAATPAALKYPGAARKVSSLPLTGAASWMDRTLASSEVRLPVDSQLDLLRRFAQPWIERPGPWRSFWTGRYGPGTWSDAPHLAWTLTANEPLALERAGVEPRLDVLPLSSSDFVLEPVHVDPTLQLSSADVLPIWKLDLTPGPDPIFMRAATMRRCEPWQRPFTATIARYGGEFDGVRLLECDGSVALDAVDKLSVLARPPGAPRPELPLPLEPEPESEAIGEWVPQVRMVDPRLIWVVARLNDAFPGRVIYLISGYRRDGHGSFHRKGRALDLFVMGVKNEDVLRVCRKLKDVGCGYYPNNKFLHVDVRPPGTGHALWVDASAPGQPSKYVDAWPGVVAGGALQWGGSE